MVAVAVVLFIAFIFLEFPIAFGMGVASAVAIAVDGKLPLTLVVQRMVAGIDSFVLLAVPFYILAGGLMETGGISMRLVVLAKALVGHIRGGLGMVSLVAEYLFSGLSGSTVADASAIGAMLIPMMKKAGYRSELTASMISAASAMGVLVPPCIPMIVLGGIASISVAALFAAGFLPAAVIALFLMLLIYLEARKDNLPAERRASLGQLGRAFVDALIPLGMPVLIFGGVLGGIFTATEAGALAVLYAVIVGVVVYREIPLRKIPQILVDAAVMSGMVMFLVGAASIFAWLMASQKVPETIASWILGFSTDPFVFMLITIAIFVFFCGVLEGVPALVIFVPILFPIARQLHIDPIHWGTVVIASLGIGLFLPPVGAGLFITCSIAKVRLDQVVPTFLPFLAVLIAGLVFVAAFPVITTIVPRMLGLGG